MSRLTSFLHISGSSLDGVSYRQITNPLSLIYLVPSSVMGFGAWKFNSKYAYLPENVTDSNFKSLALEEFRVIGSIILNCCFLPCLSVRNRRSGVRMRLTGWQRQYCHVHRYQAVINLAAMTALVPLTDYYRCPLFHMVVSARYVDLLQWNVVHL